MACGGVEGGVRLPGLLEDPVKGQIDLVPFVKRTMGLEDINKTFELMREGKSIRTVIHID